MAKSPSHRFGQTIGNLLEEVMRPRLKDFRTPRDLYLDVPGARPEIRRGKNIKWTDRYGNEHDLDFAIERGRSVEKDREGALRSSKLRGDVTRNTLATRLRGSKGQFCRSRRVTAGINRFSERSWEGSSRTDQSSN